MKLNISLIILVILVSGCKNDKGTLGPSFGLTCGSSNPTEDLVWLKDEIGALQSSNTINFDIFVNRAIYKGNTVLWVDICCPLCDVMPAKVRDCDGAIVGQLVISIKQDELSEITQIWRTNKGICP